MTAWEIGMLVSKDRLPAVKDAKRWFEEFVERAAIVVWPLTTRVLVDSSFLPHFDHGDPNGSHRRGDGACEQSGDRHARQTHSCLWNRRPRQNRALLNNGRLPWKP
jgi:hypothetical protein